MTRVTPEQAATLFDNLGIEKPRRSPAGVRGQRVKRRKEDLPENIIEGQVKGFLESRGWCCVKQQVGSFVPTGMVMRLIESGATLTKEALFRCIVRVGVKGDPDWRAERVIKIPGYMGAVQVLYFETKAPGRRPSPEQAKRIRDLQMLGWAAEWFDGFDSGRSCFLSWYSERYGEVL